MKTIQEKHFTSAGPEAELKNGDVDVWRIDVDQDSSDASSYFQILSLDEKRKAESFRAAHDRDRYVTVRGTLRMLLASYQNIDPKSICFSYNSHGKPSVTNYVFPIQFNVTHSRDVALIAIVRGKRVGIDVEFIDPRFPVMKTAHRIYSPKVIANLQTLKFDQQITAFFQYWTQTESYIKAVGTGFTDSDSPHLDGIHAAISQPSRRNFRSEDGRNWTLVNLAVGRNYKATLAVEGKMGELRYRRIGPGPSKRKYDYKAL